MHLQPKAPDTRHTFHGIQALRGFAAILVVITHSLGSWQIAVNRGSLTWDWYNGGMAVDVFFIISGFVITLTTLPPMGPRYTAGEFLTRRIERVVPSYWIATGLVLLIWLRAYCHHLPVGPPAPTFRNVLYSLFFLPVMMADGVTQFQVLIVGWSLNFEMFFYGLVTMALWLRGRAFWFLAVVMLSAPLLRVVYHPGWPLIAMNFNILLWEVLAGMLLARYILRGGIIPLPMGVSAGIAGALILFFGHFHYAPAQRVFVWGIPAFLIVAAFVSLEPRFGKHWPKALLLLGDMTYSIYLTHTQLSSLTFPAMERLGIIHANSPSVGNRLLVTALETVLAVIAGTIFYYLVEKPFDNYFRQRRQQRKAARDNYPEIPIQVSHAISARSH